MKMPEPVPGLDDRITEAVFLNIHVEGIKKNLATGAADPFGEGNTFSRGVHDELLETIDDLDAKDDTAIFGGLDRLAHTFHRPFGENLFIFAGQQLAWPRAVVDAG
jgi:hypothetical protein